MDRLLAAADRGVRIRLLVDDWNITGKDSILAMIDAHPNIEVRVFNPVAGSRSSSLSRPLHYLFGQKGSRTGCTTRHSSSTTPSQSWAVEILATSTSRLSTTSISRILTSWPWADYERGVCGIRRVLEPRTRDSHPGVRVTRSRRRGCRESPDHPRSAQGSPEGDGVRKELRESDLLKRLKPAVFPWFGRRVKSSMIGPEGSTPGCPEPIKQHGDRG